MLVHWSVVLLGDRSPLTVVADLYHRHLGGEKVREPGNRHTHPRLLTPARVYRARRTM
jgi:hypothetical protein